MLSQAKIWETIVSSFSTEVSEVELINKKIRGLSPASIYHHYSNLREKGTTARRLGSELKSYKTKEWENELTRLSIQENINGLANLSSKIILVSNFKRRDKNLHSKVFVNQIFRSEISLQNKYSDLKIQYLIKIRTIKKNLMYLLIHKNNFVLILIKYWIFKSEYLLCNEISDLKIWFTNTFVCTLNLRDINKKAPKEVRELTDI